LPRKRILDEELRKISRCTKVALGGFAPSANGRLPFMTRGQIVLDLDQTFVLMAALHTEEQRA
jgi:hypothetical protein